MLKFGLVGAGRIGRIHGSNVAARSDATLVAIADADAGAASSLAAQTGARAVSVEEAIGAAEVDAVLICAPTDMHSDLIEQAARAGKAACRMLPKRKEPPRSNRRGSNRTALSLRP